MSAYLNRLFETSSSPRATTVKQTMQNIVMAIDRWILNMTFSSEIYRRLDFGINILDEPDEHISVQEIEVSFPTRKRRKSHDLSEEKSNSVSLVIKPWEEVRLIMKRPRRKSKN